MTKNDKLYLAFGKCFNRSRLSDEECELLSNIKITELINKHALNDIQARQILLWCQLESQRKKNNSNIESCEDTGASNNSYFRT